MIIVGDTGPLVAAANKRDAAHRLASTLIFAIGKDLLIPMPVLVEVDHLLRDRLSPRVARLFASEIASGALTVDYLTPRLVKRAVAFDEAYSELNLGFVDSCVMAVAEHQRAPILTFDFKDFRATRPAGGRHWRLVVDESQYRESTS
ncbi:MAG: type II toxin-antitoxin system VapC family toxin [Actinomycetota bacterium]